MGTNECFLMRGSKMDDPMTVYFITSVLGDKLWAKRFYVGNNMVQGWPCPHEYDNAIPNNAILLPSDTWQWCKGEMLLFLKEVYKYLRENVIKEKAQIIIGCHYVGGHGGIKTVTEIGDDKIKYDLFRLDEDDISPCWTGEVNVSDTEEWYAVSEETYDEVLCRYKKLLSKLRARLCG